MRNLAPENYSDPLIFTAERERLFARSWQLLGPASQVAEAGQYLAAEIAGIKAFVLRGQDGQLRGFRNVCRHRGARLLAEGTGTCKRIRCPYHNWVYDDTGRLIAAPGFGEEPDIRLEDWPLAPVGVSVWRGLLFLAIEPQDALSDQLGETLAELAEEPLEDYRAAASERLVFDANWKIYTDNFVEGYHIPGIHPTFYASIRFDQFSTTAHDGLVRMTAPPKDGLFYRGKWLWMWPNWTLSLFEGGMNTSRINPLSAERTELIYHFYFADSVTAAARAETIAANLAVIREDFEICLQTHRNYASGGYSPGPLSPRHEAGVAYFQERWRAQMDRDLH